MTQVKLPSNKVAIWAQTAIDSAPRNEPTHPNLSLLRDAAKAQVNNSAMGAEGRAMFVSLDDFALIQAEVSATE